MKTKAYRGKLIPDLESVAKNYTESVKKSHATENEKKFVDQCNVRFVSPNNRKKKVNNNVRFVISVRNFTKNTRFSNSKVPKK